MNHLENNKNIQQRLIEKCLKKDPRAQRELYNQYVHAMYNVAYRICGNEPDAEDVIQEAFLKVFSKLSSFKGESMLGSWIKRIVVNQSISFLRSRKEFAESLTQTHEMVLIEAESDFDSEPHTMEKVMNEIALLPDGARIVFTLRAIEEYKFSEIASMLNLTETNCKVQYHRAKLLLKERLKALVFEM